MTSRRSFYLGTTVLVALLLAAGFLVPSLIPESKRSAQKSAGTSSGTGESLLCSPYPPGGNPPSIVLVLVDTLRADYLGTYGFEGEISPNIDRFANRSILFENAFSQAPWTKPSVASLFTSLPPQSHGVVYTFPDEAHGGDDSEKLRTVPLPRSLYTIAEAFCDNGYATAAFVANGWLAKGLGYEQGFQHYDDAVVGNMDARDDEVLSRARQWLENRSRRRPFFLYIHLMNPHGPYAAPEEDYQEVRRFFAGGESLEDAAFEDIPEYLRAPSWTTSGAARTLGEWKARYAAGIRALDRHLGPFFEYLDSSGLLDESIVVFTSDHGEELYDHKGWDHGFNLYDHQTHVPLVLSLPDGRHAGAKREEIVSLIDLMPTLLRKAGIRVPSQARGRDLKNILEGHQEDALSKSFAAGVRGKPAYHALRTSAYKYHLDLTSGEQQLFDLREDPGEQSPLVEERVPGQRSSFMQELMQYVAETETARPEDAAPVPIDEKLLKKLRSLGYVN